MTEEVSLGVEYPYMRRYMVDALESLSDPEYQQRIWIDHILPHPMYYDDFTNAINILFDDLTVCEEPDEAVGKILFRDEVELLRRLGDVLDDILGDETLDADADYLADPRWPANVEVARQALSRVRENGEGFGPRSQL